MCVNNYLLSCSFQPAHSPELNPVKNLWHHLRLRKILLNEQDRKRAAKNKNNF